MGRFIINILIIGASVALVIAFVKPELATSVVDRVLGSFVETPTSALLPSNEKALNTITALQSNSKQKESQVSSDVVTSDRQGDTLSGILDSGAIIDATNRNRIAAGLTPLTVSKRLSASAKIKTEDMIARHYFEHVSPTGQNVSDLGARVGYEYIVMGENLALGNFANADDLLTAWMNSPGHRANILSINYQEIGVYVARGTYQGKEVWFAVQHFGTQRTACPSINKALKTAIEQTNQSLKDRQVEITKQKEILEGPDRPQGELYKIKVTRFNALVGEYNALLQTSQKDIARYNAQVKLFNSCLTKYQTTK